MISKKIQGILLSLRKFNFFVLIFQCHLIPPKAMAKTRLCLLLLLSVFKFCLSDPATKAFNLCSLEPLDPNEGFVDSDSGLKFLWNLCTNQTTRSNPCNDSSAAVCVFKVSPFLSGVKLPFNSWAH